MHKDCSTLDCQCSCPHSTQNAYLFWARGFQSLFTDLGSVDSPVPQNCRELCAEPLTECWINWRPARLLMKVCTHDIMRPKGGDMSKSISFLGICYKVNKYFSFVQMLEVSLLHHAQSLSLVSNQADQMLKVFLRGSLQAKMRSPLVRKHSLQSLQQLRWIAVIAKKTNTLNLNMMWK